MDVELTEKECLAFLDNLPLGIRRRIGEAFMIYGLPLETAAEVQGSKVVEMQRKIEEMEKKIVILEEENRAFKN